MNTTITEIEYTIEIEPEEIPYKGNCSAIDEETDRETENWIRNQLRKGNRWAWCTVKVTASYEGYEGVAYLGCCSYHNKKDFMHPDGYYPQMQEEARDDLLAQLKPAYEAYRSLMEHSDVGTNEK